MGNRLIVSVVLLSSASLSSIFAQGHGSRHNGGHHSQHGCHQHAPKHQCSGHGGHCHHQSNHTNTQYGYVSPAQGSPNVVIVQPVPAPQPPIIVLSVPIIF